jgi:hypothetical protein
MTRLGAAEARRLNTFLSEIATALLPGVTHTDTGDERRYHDTGLGLSINLKSGAWFAHARGKGGWHALALIALIKGCPWGEAVEYGAAWLASHPGTGSVLGCDDDSDVSETKKRASAARAREIIDAMVPVEGTVAESYLRSRKLEPPYPDCVGFLEHARVGESALVGLLQANDRVTGLQLLYLSPHARKSLVEPLRQRFDLESAPGAVFEIRTEIAVTDLHHDVVIAEGLEDALSLARLGRHFRICGLPGAGALRHLGVKLRTPALIVRDGDESGSAAARVVTAGIDHLILDCQASVKVTDTPPSKDANAILQEHGLAELGRLVDEAKETGLSQDGEFERLARLDPVEFDREAPKVAKRLGIYVNTVRAEAKKRRLAPTRQPTAEQETTAGIKSAPEDAPWTGPVPQLATLLDTISAQLHRFIVMSAEQATTVTLWCAAAHLLHSSLKDKAGKDCCIELFPKLALQSKDPASGKTTLLTLIWNLLPRAKLWTYPSGAYLVRAIEVGNFSLCLDELQYAEDRNLLRVINASHQKSLAYVPLLVPDTQGGWNPVEFPVWVPMALARLGEFPAAQQSRSIVIWMLPKLPGERRDRLRDAVVPELVECRRQLAASAKAVTVWVDPVIPATLHNRDLNNWEPLLFVAGLAGERWLKAAHEAIEAQMRIERRPTPTQRLLRSIWKSYQPNPDEEPIPFMASSELLAKLIGDGEEDWNTINRGGPITYDWLRERLSHLLDPPGSQQDYYIDDDGKRRHRRGYSFAQFKDGFARYVGTHPLSMDTPTLPCSPGSAGSTPENSSKSAGSSEPGVKSGPVHPVQHPVQRNSSKSAADSTSRPREPGEPGNTGHPQEHIHPFASTTAGDKTSPAEPEKPVKISDGVKDYAALHGFDPVVLATVLACRKDHPAWSAEQVRKALKVKQTIVEQVLNDPELRHWGLV